MQLDRRIKATFDDIVGHTPDIGDAPNDHIVDVSTYESRGRPRMWLGAAAVVAVLGLIGVMALVNRGRSTAPGADVATQPSDAVNETTVPTGPTTGSGEGQVPLSEGAITSFETLTPGETIEITHTEEMSITGRFEPATTAPYCVDLQLAGFAGPACVEQAAVFGGRTSFALPSGDNTRQLVGQIVTDRVDRIVTSDGRTLTPVMNVWWDITNMGSPITYTVHTLDGNETEPFSIDAGGAGPDEGTAMTNPVANSISAAFSFSTPTVRLDAERIEVIVGDLVSFPTAADADSDPGNSEYTSLDLSWSDGGREQRLFLSFASDGAYWWADTVRTYDANGEWIDTPEGQRWFTSPLGQAWSGDLDLPNLRITSMTIEAFLRPAACDNPTSPIAVVAAYPRIKGVAGEGSDFSGRIDLIDTATCDRIDPTSYTFNVVVDDPTVAEVIDQDQANGSTTTVLGGSSTPSEGTVEPQPSGRFYLAFLNPGETNVRVTVTDSAGTVIGTTTTPVTVRAPD